MPGQSQQRKRRQRQEAEQQSPREADEIVDADGDESREHTHCPGGQAPKLEWRIELLGGDSGENADDVRYQEAQAAEQKGGLFHGDAGSPVEAGQGKPEPK